jgi:hypothetical protein
LTNVRSVEVGLITRNGCPDAPGYDAYGPLPPDPWMIYGAYTHSPNSTEPSGFRTQCPFPTTPGQVYGVRTEVTNSPQSSRQSQTSSRGLRGSLFYRPPGASSDRLLYVYQSCPDNDPSQCSNPDAQRGRYRLVTHAGRATQAESEVNDNRRQMPGYYSSVRWKSRATTGLVSSANSYTLATPNYIDVVANDEYGAGGTGSNPGFYTITPTNAHQFCTYGPTKDPGVKPFTRESSVSLQTSCP